jgi:hypothetical protein
MGLGVAVLSALSVALVFDSVPSSGIADRTLWQKALIELSAFNALAIAVVAVPWVAVFAHVVRSRSGA